MLFCRLQIFKKVSFFLKKKYFRNAIRMSNSLDPNQDRHFVGPDLDASCLHRLSAVNNKMLLAGTWLIGKGISFALFFCFSCFSSKNILAGSRDKGNSFNTLYSAI